MSWGIEVPGDPEQVMYVWFDALVNYISALGWPENEKNFSTWWPGYQMAGKDNLRPQSAMWQAMLMSAGLEPSRQIFIHGFITSNGQKMSKSSGNVAHPYELIEDYGADALRYYLLREVPPMEDGDYTPERFLEVYNAGLANGLGNLVSRVVKMAENFDAWPSADKLLPAEQMIKEDFFQEFREALESYQFARALDFIWLQIKEADLYVQNVQPFKVFKTGPEEAREQVRFLLESLWRISVALTPVLPTTALKIQKLIKKEIPLEPLFLRR
jgi:methionyl-tRNA synthetase